MRRRKLRVLVMMVACGGLVLGTGCGAFITDTLLQIGLSTILSNVFTATGVLGG